MRAGFVAIKGTVTLECVATCNDGVKNGDETGEDCGGSCAPCCPENIGITINKYPYCPDGREGNFTVSARGLDLEYSINNGQTYQDNPTFGNRKGNRYYNIKVRSKATGCESTRVRIFLDCAETCPTIEGVTLEEPSCDKVSTGTMTVNLGPGQSNTPSTSVYEFSIDGGLSWQKSNIFPVEGGAYTVLVNNLETNCSDGFSGIMVGCVSCFDGIKNGDETETDCGGSCHSCNCPTVEEIKLSAESIVNEGGEGEGEAKVFICDEEAYFDCPECVSYRLCHDDIDNDGDALCDCEDEECSTWYDEVCTKPKEACEDGIDNDGDGLIDCDDPDCQSSQFCGFLGDGPNKTSELDFKHELIDLIYDSNVESQLLRNFGLPRWRKSFNIDELVITPVVQHESKSVAGVFVTQNTVNEGFIFDFISKERVRNSIKGLSEGDSVDGNDFSWNHPTFELASAAGILIKADLKYSSTYDLLLAVYLSEWNDVTTRNGNVCYFRICYDRCVEWEDEQVSFDHGPNGRMHVFKDEHGNITRIGCTNCNGGGTFDTEFQCLRSDHTCVDLPFTCEGSSNPSSLDPEDFLGGGSGSGSTSVSETLNDRLKNCNTEASSLAEGTGVAFCAALRDIIECTAQTGLFSSENVHNNLMTLASIPDCDPMHPLSDDPGMLSEIATYLCETNPPTTANNSIQHVLDYAENAGLVGPEEASCFDDFIELAQLLEQYDIYTIQRVLTLNTHSHLLSSIQTFLTEPDLETKALAIGLYLDFLNLDADKLNFDSAGFEEYLSESGISDPMIVSRYVIHKLVFEAQYKLEHGVECDNLACQAEINFKAMYWL